MHDDPLPSALPVRWPRFLLPLGPALLLAVACGDPTSTSNAADPGDVIGPQATPEVEFCTSVAASLCRRYFECFSIEMLSEQAPSLGANVAECADLLSGDCGRFDCGDGLHFDVPTGDECVEQYETSACSSILRHAEPNPCLFICKASEAAP